jgi:hypothetical protein
MHETPLLFPFNNSIVHLLLELLFVWDLPSLGGRDRPSKQAGTGRNIFSTLLGDGEEVVLTRKNALFGLRVTEVF